MVVSAVEEKPEVVLIVQLSEEKFGATRVGKNIVAMVLSTVDTRSESAVLIVILFEGAAVWRVELNGGGVVQSRWGLNGDKVNWYQLLF